MNELRRPARLYLFGIWATALFGAFLTYRFLAPTNLALHFIVLSILGFVLADYFEVEFETEAGTTVRMTVVETAIVFLVPIAGSTGILVIAIGSIIADTILQRAWYRGLFNASHRVISFIVMLLTYQLLIPPGSMPYSGLPGLVALVAIVAIFFLLNPILVSTIIALASGQPLFPVYQDGLRQMNWVHLITLPLGALLAVVWVVNPLLITSGILLLLMAHRSFRNMAELQAQSQRSRELAVHAQQLASKLERLQDTTTTMLASPDPLPLLQTVSERLKVLLDAGAAWAVLFDDPPRLIRSINGNGRFVWDPELYRQELHDRELHHLDATSIRRLHGDAAERWSTLFLIPMLAEDRLVGGLCLAFEQPVELSDDNRRVLLAFAAQAALVVERVQLFDELQAKQDELIRSSKLAALGTFAAGIAHEFNNLLAAVIGFAQLGLSSDDVAEKDEALEVATRACQRGQSITGGLLTFARRRESRRELTDLRTVVEDTVVLVQREFTKSNVHVELQLEPVPQTVCDPGQIAQVVMNMLTNARDALVGDGGGRITIGLSQHDQEIELIVKDSGCGIPEELLPQIFQPFMTTKGALGGGNTSGTGLGLAISYGIIENHGGTIDVDSILGQGTTMTIRLPIVGSALIDDEPSMALEQMASLRILIVDDEFDIAESLRRILERYGHEVVTASDGRTALDIFQVAPFDLVISDAIMPGLGGVDLVRALREEDPHVAILAVSGQTDSPQVRAMLDHGALAVLTKPFETDDLLRAIRRCIGDGVTG
jgi:two-component system NtrC family sensor kinase